MSSVDAINKCIRDCKDSASRLRSLANSETNPQIKMALNEGAHQLDLCVTECQYSLQQINSQ